MNHPDDLLVDYVDGSLRDPDRAAVAAHLSECVRCRDEVAMAHAARAALSALPDEAMPGRVRQAVMREVPPRPVRAGAPVWYRWAGVGAAAAVVVLIAVTVPSLRDHQESIVSPEDAAAAPATSGSQASMPPEDLTLQVSRERLTSGSIYHVTSSYRSAYAADATAETSQGLHEALPVFGVLRAEPGGTQAAVECLRGAFRGALVGAPIRLVEATYEGERVYIEVTESGSEAGSRPHTVHVWIAAKADCSIVNSTQALIEPGGGG